jgi:FAD/FMN-containing dehydrogenase
MSTAETLQPRWTNWVGNQSFSPTEIVQAHAEGEVIDTVRRAVRAGQRLRVPGSGHSFTPVVETDGILLDAAALTGIISTDHDNATATAWAQTKIVEFGPALWDQGLALSNQGDIDGQAIAGAIATATHGSGIRLRNFSASLVGARLVDGRGNVHDVDAQTHPDLLPALQTSLGTLGVMTRVTLQVSHAYKLHERIVIMHVDEVLERWDELIQNYRHFSFFWMTSDASARLYNLDAPANRCYVKLYQEYPADAETPELKDHERFDCAYKIYPMVFDPNFHEMEYFLPLQGSRDHFKAQRELMLARPEDAVIPVEVRFCAADNAWLSPNFERSNMVVSVAGVPGTDYWPYLRRCDSLFRECQGRPHWGKLHFMTPTRMTELFPHYEEFRRLRSELDPGGTFLNPHLRELFGG